MLVNIPEEIIQRLNQLALDKGESVEVVLKTLLDQYAPQPSSGSLAELAQNARDAGLTSSHQVNTAEASRDILNTEYADYLKRRQTEGSDADSDG